ncbi:FAD-binding oxidoreductase [Aeromicrobium sp.]|uniref:FAD-binding oxidoreductase n=3 Tax=Aeromicrobium sp. TaxID=1871063 RepID=UPI003519AE55
MDPIEKTPVGTWKGVAPHDGREDAFLLSFADDGTVALRTPASEGHGAWTSRAGGFSYTLVETLFDREHPVQVHIAVDAVIDGETYRGSGTAEVQVAGRTVASTTTDFVASRTGSGVAPWHVVAPGPGYLRADLDTTVAAFAALSEPIETLVPRTDEDWRGWNLTLDVPPALVVRPRDGRQVAAALRVADDHGWPVAVQATGHGASVELGRSILLDLSGLDDVELRPDTVVVGAGVRWRDVLPTVVAAGGIALCGSSPDVGVAGYLSGGGLPVLARSHGMAADTVRSLEVATVDGELRVCSPSQQPDLFAASLGGRGNAGVIVSAEIATPVLASFVGGNLTFGEEDVDEAIRTWAAWSRDLPQEMSSSLVVLRFPDLPQTPPEKRNRYFVQVRVAYVGSLDAADALLKPLRALTVEADTVGPMPYDQIGQVYLDPPRATPAWIETRVLDELPDEAVEALVSVAGQHATLPFGGVELRQLGGVLASTASVSTASHAREGYQLFVTNPAFEDRREEVFAAQRSVLDALAPWLPEKALPGFLFSKDQTRRRVRRAYDDADWEALCAAKETYDPMNVLRVNHNISRG